MSNPEILSIKRDLQNIKNDLLVRKTQKNGLEKRIEEIETKKNNIEILSEDTNAAFIFLKQRAADTRNQAMSTIEKVVSDGLTYMFQEQYLFQFKPNENSSSETGAFNLTPKVIKEIDGELVEKCPYNSNGGGLIEIISILLRFSFIVYRRYNGLVLLDEALASVSADKMMDRLVAFLNAYIEDLRLQSIFITHRPDRFAKIANKNFLVVRENGLAVAKEMSSTQLLEHYMSIENEKE